MQHFRKKHGLVYELVKPTLDYGRKFRALTEKTQCRYLFKVVVSVFKLHHQQFCRSGLNLKIHTQKKQKVEKDTVGLPMKKVNFLYGDSLWFLRNVGARAGLMLFWKTFMFLERHIFKSKLIIQEGVIMSCEHGSSEKNIS